MKALRATALLLLLATGASAQYNPYWQWAKADTGAAMSLPAASSVLAVKNGKAFWGRMTGIGRFDAAGIPQGRYTLAEYDSTGKGGNATAIAGKVQLMDALADPGGNWYVIGRFWDSAIFANGITLLRPGPASNNDPEHFVARFNAGSLTLSWVQRIGPSRFVSARAFTADATRLYVAADSFDNTIVQGMAFSNGAANTFFRQSGSSVSTSIQVDGSGGIYLAGSCAQGTLNFNGATETGTPPDNYSYIVKYNNAGAHQWHYWFKNMDCSQRKLTLYRNSILYYTGTLRDSFKIGTGPLVVRPGGGGYLAARLAPMTGAVVWTRTLDTMGGGGTVAGDPYHAVVTPDSAVALFLQSSGYINWGDTFTTNLQSVRSAAVLASISATDSVRWVRTVYGDLTTNAHVAAEGDGVWVCGVAYSTNATILLDTLKLTVPPLTYTPYMARLKLTRPKFAPNPTNGVGGVAGQHAATVAPIPAHTGLRIGGLAGGEAALMDITGRRVKVMAIATGAEVMDVAALPRGAYLLELRGADGSRDVRRVVLE